MFLQYFLDIFLRSCLLIFRCIFAQISNQKVNIVFEETLQSTIQTPRGIIRIKNLIERLKICFLACPKHNLFVIAYNFKVLFNIV